MKSYYLFAGLNYYPHGGVEDFRGIYPSLEEAKVGLAEQAITIAGGSQSGIWAHIADSEMKMVAYASVQPESEPEWFDGDSREGVEWV